MMFCDAKNPIVEEGILFAVTAAIGPIAEGAINTSCPVNLIVMQPQLCGSCGSIDVYDRVCAVHK